jgi:predicted ATPase/DNA-binding XRE family transcriptional regulator
MAVGGFGETVRGLRAAAGLTQAELAEGAGISERTVSDLERGLRTSVYPATARSLAEALGVAEPQRTEFLLAATGGAGPTSLSAAPIPVPLTALLGRDAELAALIQLLEAPETRLVTVVGPGGIGKTRLAIEAAAATCAAAGIPGMFVSLSAIDSPGQVMPTIATALRLVQTGDDAMDVLAGRLRDAPALLIIDTFEHVVDAAADVARLLAACPPLKVLVTSRSPLRVRGELEFPVRALSLESAGGALSPAVALFVERARAVAPALAITDDVIDVVADICARLDGLPLAIELAAARARHLPITQLRRDLDHRLDTLTGGARDLPGRHRTMRGAFDWSYALLDAPQMRTFRALGVLRDGFDRAAVAAISGADEDHAVMAALDGLVDASLVIFDAALSSAGRYRLLDTGREYALERATDAGEVAELSRRHAEHYVKVAEEAEPRMRGDGQREAFDALALDWANMRAAIHWALATGEGETALRLCGALWMFWRWAGLFREGRTLVDAALGMGTETNVDIRCQALWGGGWLAFHAGDYARTAELGETMLTLLRPRTDGLLVRNALTLVGNAALGDDQAGDAVLAMAAALQACEPAAPGWHMATSLLNLGTAQRAAGHNAEAKRHLDAALAMYRELGDRHFTARALAQLAYLRLDRADASAANLPADEAMEIFAGLGDRWAIAEGLEAVAAVRAEGAPEVAVALIAAARRIREEIGMKAHPPDEPTIDRQLAVARALLSTARYERAWRKGEELTPDEAVTLALPPTSRSAARV